MTRARRRRAAASTAVGLPGASMVPSVGVAVPTVSMAPRSAGAARTGGAVGTRRSPWYVAAWLGRLRGASGAAGRAHALATGWVRPAARLRPLFASRPDAVAALGDAAAAAAAVPGGSILVLSVVGRQLALGRPAPNLIARVTGAGSSDGVCCVGASRVVGEGRAASIRLLAARRPRRLLGLGHLGARDQCQGDQRRKARIRPRRGNSECRRGQFHDPDYPGLTSAFHQQKV